ncbi:guanosine pentaphosphate phosphohydrolase [Weissella oryzae SG25]|uniref:Guanosine pentaphosphate phosphohydrolase n=1 Tax=Weissella oryzae (strain DSM 25784 / JCM 18191 / LMG 30913 / SG25) TaxID=1329250 RepID=A0A069CTA7_WEIOS|nr:hypothetical protein [Weissella oryzae]GAK31045.1 guanosine pentaphosphate phosphohydrolase [Weissella oryzae SG25]
MAAMNAKSRFQKKLEQFDMAKNRVDELAEAMKEAKEEYLLELMARLQKKLNTDDLNELERFINNVKPLEQTPNASFLAKQEVEHGN